MDFLGAPSLGPPGRGLDHQYENVEANEAEDVTVDGGRLVSHERIF